MPFPVWTELFGLRIHPHFLFESLAYVVAFRFYLHQRAVRGDALGRHGRWWVIAAAILGAVIGSKVLYWLSDPLHLAGISDPEVALGGKSIVGGLLGGLLAVEMAKRRLGIGRSTGDLFAAPLALGIAIGRIGCFLTGLPDQTHGDPSALPWAVDFGDGVPRHPTQLYEIAFLVGLLMVLRRLSTQPRLEGDEFKVFMIGYLSWRLAVGFIQPGFAYAGLTAIQWACVVGLAYYARFVPRLVSHPKVIAPA